MYEKRFPLCSIHIFSNTVLLRNSSVFLGCLSEKAITFKTSLWTLVTCECIFYHWFINQKIKLATMKIMVSWRPSLRYKILRTSNLQCAPQFFLINCYNPKAHYSSLYNQYGPLSAIMQAVLAAGQCIKFHLEPTKATKKGSHQQPYGVLCKLA